MLRTAEDELRCLNGERRKGGDRRRKARAIKEAPVTTMGIKHLNMKVRAKTRSQAFPFVHGVLSFLSFVLSFSFFSPDLRIRFTRHLFVTGVRDYDSLGARSHHLW